MVGYKLSKNDWVTPFFVIFRSVREKLLVTVSFDHPVARGFCTFGFVDDTGASSIKFFVVGWELLLFFTPGETRKQRKDHKYRVSQRSTFLICLVRKSI